MPKRTNEQLRHLAYTRLVDAAMHAAAALAARSPRFDLGARGFRVERDVRYANHDACHLDIYAPKNAERAPVVVYIHGGGFKLGSKRSHAAIAEPLVTAGHVVVLIDYRLAPAHPFPAALDDCAEAYLWVVANIARYGGDPSRLAIAGESAGGNLTLALTLATAHRFLRPSLRRVYDLGAPPKAMLPLCGYLQVSDPERFDQIGRGPHPVVRDRMKSVSRGYLEGADPEHGLDLASPLLVLESSLELDRPLPPAFISCGEKDPILDDSLRLARSLAARGSPYTLRLEPGALHGYQAVVITGAAARHWAHAVDFLRAHL